MHNLLLKPKPKNYRQTSKPRTKAKPKIKTIKQQEVYRKAEREKNTYTKICKECKKEFQTKISQQMYCCLRCLQHKHAEKERNRLHELNWAHGTFWQMQECTKDDPDPEKLFFDFENKWWKWVKIFKP